MNTTRQNGLRLVAVLCFLPVFSVWGVAQTEYDTSPPAQTGQQVYGSYFSADFDTVGVYNGNVMLNIGLFNLPGRELSMGLALSYNSQKWEEHTCSDGSGGSIPCGMYTGGWRVGNPFGGDLSVSVNETGSICYEDEWVVYGWAEVNAYWIDGIGTKHRYKTYACNESLDGLILPTVDGDHSQIVLKKGASGDYTSWISGGYAYLAFPNGHVLSFENASPVKITTANGNYLTKSTNGSKLPTQDTLGRTVSYTAGTIGSSSDTYTITDSNGSSATYSIRYKTITAWDPWRSTNNNQTMGSDRTVIDFITLPNGKQWTFEYGHDQGFLTKATMPSGAYVKFEYYGGNTDHDKEHDYVVSRKVSVDGTTGGEKTWAYSRAVTSSTRTITTTAPEGDVRIETFNLQGEGSQTQWKGSASGPVLKTVTKDWYNAAIETNLQPNNPRVSWTATTLDSGLSSTTSLSYGAYNMVQYEETTAWGSSTVAAKKFHDYTTFQQFVNATQYFQRVLPYMEVLYGIDPVTGTANTQFGTKVFYYDDYTLTSRSGVPNHNGYTGQYSRGNLTRVRNYKDATNYMETKTKYDILGNAVETIDNANRSTTISYTDDFCTLNSSWTCTNTSSHSSFAYPTQVTNPLSQTTSTKYDYSTGLPTVITNLRGNPTRTKYDGMNRVVEVREPEVGSTAKITTYAYDDTNRKTTKEVTVDTSGNKGHVETFFDKLYRTTKTVTNDPEGAITVETEYDNNGRVKKTSNPYKTGITVVWTQTAYDGLSRPLTVTAPDSSTISYSYTNNVTTTTDQAGNQRRYTYNILGQLTTVEEPNPTLANPLSTTYTYYVFGSLYRSNQSNQTRTWVYNWLGQMTSQALPESGTTTFTYNSPGLLVTKTDARNIVTTMTYDNADRATQRSYSDSTPTVSFTYDQNGYTGQRTTMADGLGTVTYAYDARERLTQESRTLTGVNGTFATSYVYNVKGDVTQMTYPSGRVVNFAYATGGGCCNSRLSSVSDGTTSTTLLNSISFDAAGGPLSRTLNPGSNAIVETFSYNNRLQVEQIKAVKGSTTLMEFNYNYGTSTTNTGRVLSRTDAVQPEHSAVYAYDPIYRLQQAADDAGTWAIGWTFDTWGNRLTQTPSGLATSKVGSPTIAYTSNRNQAHTYDSAGNTTNDTVHNYAYNAENQQTSMDGGAATYVYDGEGRRMKKVTSAETTYTFYGPGGVLCEFSTSTALSSATAAASTDKTVYRTSERTGTAVLLFDTSGAVIENNRTLPYGEAWLADATPSANGKKFTTYDRDKESGLDYAMARMYSNSSARFTSPDRGSVFTSIPTSLNRYTYSLMDPINLRDPSGNEPMLVGDPGICEFFGGELTGGTYTDDSNRKWYYCDLPGAGGGTPDPIQTPEPPGGGAPATPAAPGSLAHLFGLLGESRQRVIGLLGNNECATALIGQAGDGNSAEAIDRLRRVSFFTENYGLPQLTTNPGGTTTWLGSAAATAVLGSLQITWNIAMNWADPSNSSMIADGSIARYNWLAAYAAEVGDPSMTANQLMDHVLLHELSHSFGVNHSADQSSFNQNIWQKCFN